MRFEPDVRPVRGAKPPLHGSPLAVKSRCLGAQAREGAVPLGAFEVRLEVAASLADAQHEYPRRERVERPAVAYFHLALLA